MNKILRVGDPHVQIKNLSDCRKLIDFIIETANQQDVDVIEFLGDMFHTHAVVRVEIIDFWRKALLDIVMNTGKRVVCLVGNHDQPGSKEKEQEMNSLLSLKGLHKDIIIVDKPLWDDVTKVGYIPYHSDEESFFKAAEMLNSYGINKCIVAHQTFTGAQYENGFFSEDGIDPGKAPQEQIISGHIHKSQFVGKCFYPGTPKWDTMSDANQEKGIWVFKHDNDGKYLDMTFFPTKEIVTPITSYEIKEGDDLPDLNPNARNYVVLEGKSAWITKIKKKLKDLAHIKVKPTDRVIKINREESLTLDNYLEKEFEPIEGISKKEIKVFLEQL